MVMRRRSNNFTILATKFDTLKKRKARSAKATK